MRRVGIGIVLIAAASILFVVLLQENTPWILVTSPLFGIGFVLIYSKVYEIEEDIARLEEKLNKFIKESKK